MCLNEKLTFNIKIKSRNCELFVLKKNDFLRLSVNFKEFIENFLHKSLMKYLKFNEEKNKMIKEFEALMSKCNGEGKDLDRTGSIKNDLQAIEEEKDDAEIEEITDEELINDSDNSNEEEKTKKASNKDPLSPCKKQSISNSHTFNIEQCDKKNSKNSLQKTLTYIKNDPISVTDEKMNSIEGDDKMKHQLNNKFQKKVDKIIEYIDKNNFKFEQSGKNPKELLLQLKNDIDLNEKNNIIEQLEIILKDFYNANKGSSNGNGSVGK